LAELKRVMRELDAIIIIIRVVAIQNGPYKSGLLSIINLKEGFKKRAALIL
jgi:hypothetical protein